MDRVEADGCGVRRDFGDGAHLAGPHDLMLIEQEDGHASGGDQLVDLRAPGTGFGSGVTILGGGPHPMGFIQDQDVEAVALGLGELVEVFEQAGGATAFATADLAQGHGEGTGAGRVDRSAATLGQLAQQRERDHALAATRPSADDDHRLGVGAACGLDGMHDHVDCDELLVQQDELLTPGDLLGGDLEELPRWCHSRTQKLIGVGSTGDFVVEPGLAGSPGKRPRSAPVNSRPVELCG